jgi:copper chaperone CopZ
MTTSEYHIPNISCEHCVHTITMELGELEGVREVEVSQEARRVRVSFEPPASERSIVDLLAEIHYPPA